MARMRTEYHGLSARAKALLRRGEGTEVEYKSSVSSLESDDIVQFANSPLGGTILVGVKEVHVNGRQEGEVIGCSVSDSDRNRIVSKARDCRPPVDIQIYRENMGRVPFFRVEIPSSKNKPHSTGGGRYLIRSDGQTRPLYPEELLTLFESKEADRFLDRFRAATATLERSVDIMQVKIHAQLAELMDQVDSLSQVAEGLLNDILAFSDATQADLPGLQERIEVIEEAVIRSERKLLALLEYLRVEDPDVTRARRLVNGILDALHRRSLSIPRDDLMDILETTFPAIHGETLAQWVADYNGMQRLGGDADRRKP